MASVWAAVIGGVAMGVLWLLGLRWRLAWRWGLGCCLGTFGVCEVAFLLEHRFVYTSGAKLAWHSLRPAGKLPVESQPRFIPVCGPSHAAKAPTAPGNGREHNLLHKGADLVRGWLRGPATQHQGSVESEAAAWVCEMYDVLCKVWPTGDLTRRSFETLFRPGGTALWRKYVSGDGSGRHAGRGILHTWGVISQTGPRGSWEFCQPLGMIFALDPALKRYAERLASPTLSNGSRESANGASPNRTKPDNQTKHQKKEAIHGTDE